MDPEISVDGQGHHHHHHYHHRPSCIDAVAVVVAGTCASIYVNSVNSSSILCARLRSASANPTLMGPANAERPGPSEGLGFDLPCSIIRHRRTSPRIIIIISSPSPPSLCLPPSYRFSRGAKVQAERAEGQSIGQNERHSCTNPGTKKQNIFPRVNK